MQLPDIWGQGALFCHSGLDGETTFSDNITGTLCGDKLGVILHKLGRVELFLGTSGVKNIRYEIVAGDVIRAVLTDAAGAEHLCGFVFYRQAVIKGVGAFCARPMLSAFIHAVVPDGAFKTVSAPEEGLHCALAVVEQGDTLDFALAFSGISLADAEQKAMQAATADWDAVCASKLAFYQKLPVAENLDPEIEKTLYKCFSVMKTQVYSPEGRFSTLWTTPDRLPHRRCWLWDSVFHALGNRHISPQLAYQTLEALFSFQREDGLISHMAGPRDASPVTQPPIIAWGFCSLYDTHPDRSRLAGSYENLKRYIRWNLENRDSNGNKLCEWVINPGQSHNPCDESGMDNTPRFDHFDRMDCVDFSCYMANEARCMARIAGLLGKEPAEIDCWNSLYRDIRQAINDVLWDEEDGFYYDRILASHDFRQVKAVSGFLPLFAGICDQRQAEKLAEHLSDRNSFYLKMPVPSVARNDPHFANHMWRGAVWVNYNDLIAAGLRAYGYDTLAADIVRRTVQAITQWYLQEGCLFECYDGDGISSPRRFGRKGPPVEPYDFSIRMQTIRDYGWTASLYAELVLSQGELFQRK